jgi:hypothetical protein
MIAHKKKFFSGFGLLLSFGVVLAILFSPVFNGQNGLNYFDALYNSISKDSAYYIPALKKDAANFEATPMMATIKMADEKQATQVALLFGKAGAEATVSGKQVAVNGKLGKVFENCLEDADSMYHNDGKTVSSKYGMEERQVIYYWYMAMKSLSKDLTRQALLEKGEGRHEKLKGAKMIDSISKKAVELSYNYYTIEPRKISESVGIVSFSLVFYVIYTMWFGFAVLFMFEGWGLKLEH